MLYVSIGWSFHKTSAHTKYKEYTTNDNEYYVSDCHIL